jgi:hypothetical protein
MGKFRELVGLLACRISIVFLKLFILVKGRDLSEGNLMAGRLLL